MTGNIIKSPFNEKIIFYLDKISNVNGSISTDEYKYIKNSVEKRQKEFIAGRTLAHKALNDLSIKNYEVLSGQFREPIWPKNIIGSISHSNKYCCAVTTRNQYYAGIGIDIEENETIDPSQYKILFTKNELNTTLKDSIFQNINVHKLVFSMKESLYKCIFPLVKRYIDFQQVEIYINPKTRELEISNLDNTPEIDKSLLECNYIAFKDHMLTYVIYNHK